MLNITQYSDNELTDNFLNDEYLYGQTLAVSDISELISLADDIFIYTPDQLSTLKQYFHNGGFEE